MSPFQTTLRSVRPASILPLLAALCLTLPIVACGGDGEGAAVSAEPPPAAAESVPPAGDGGEFTPVTSRSEEPTTLPAEGPAAEGAAIQAPGITFNLPQEWEQEPPSSNMRLAQATIPAPQGSDAGSAELTVFYFGPGGGGGVDANLDRWVGQMAVDPATPPRRMISDLGGGLRAHWLEVQGTLQPSMMGTGPTEPQPDSTLLGAIVEGPQGPWFFKATGPAETLDAQRDAFFAMLRSIQPTA